MKMMQLRKAHCSPPLVGEDNSMVFTSHSVPFPATHGWKWHLVRDKNHFIFFTPVTVNKNSWHAFRPGCGVTFGVWMQICACIISEALIPIFFSSHWIARRVQTLIILDMSFPYNNIFSIQNATPTICAMAPPSLFQCHLCNPPTT